MISVEFAIVASVLIPITSAIIELGLLLWTLTAMQSVASLAARCGAISSPLCSSSGGTTVPAYAVTLATNWTMTGMISSGNVTVGSSTTCNNASGAFETVTITVPVWSRVVLRPFLPDTLNVSACYPT